MQLRVVMIARPNLYSVPGGDTVQVNETAKALRALHVLVDIIVNGPVQYKNYDLIHFFNIIDPEDILGHVYKSDLPYVVSTIYVDYSGYDKSARTGFIGKMTRLLSRDSIEYLKTLAKYLYKHEQVSTPRFFVKGHKASIQYIARKASLLLPNSENEYRRLQQDYGVQQQYRVVPNAIDPELFRADYPSGAERDLVLCVARIEGQKNQLNVIRALKDTGLKLVFIGADSPNQKSYSELCQKEAGALVQFIHHLPQHELLQYYARARVHILASWFETTGLSSLEAGAMGCNVVVAARGDVADYFGERVQYCDPGDIASIKHAVLTAWNMKPSADLKQHIFDHFTWDRAGEATLAAYKIAIKL